MVEPNGGDQQPLPRDWLPDASAPDGAPEWDVTLQRILAAAEPSLRQLQDASTASDVTWSAVLGSWWKPAAAIAAAAALLLLLDGRDTEDRAAQGVLPLSVMAAQGDPFALWQSLGIEADPVLALIALQQERR
jgi:hypothetical protein